MRHTNDEMAHLVCKFQSLHFSTTSCNLEMSHLIRKEAASVADVDSSLLQDTQSVTDGNLPCGQLSNAVAE